MLRRLRNRKGQAMVEYTMTTVALIVAFAGIYRVMQYNLKKEFQTGATIVVSMYK